MGERENGRARGRHTLACLLLGRAFFLVPSTSKRLLRRLLIPICSHLKELRWVNQLYLKLKLNTSTQMYTENNCIVLFLIVRHLLECRFSDLWDDRWLIFLNYQVCTYQRPSQGDGPREPPVIRTPTFTNPPYPKPRLFSYQRSSLGLKTCAPPSQKVNFKRVLLPLFAIPNPLSYKRPLSNKPLPAISPPPPLSGKES